MTKKTTDIATLGGGCFWCLEAVYQRVKGIEKVESGYAGGRMPHPNYEDVSGGKTGHAEVVQLTFDPEVITYEQILEVFWTIHDPTTPNRQGNDIGTQYRSIILYHNNAQKASAEASKDAAQKAWGAAIVTEITPFDRFYAAEDYHQNYFANHPEQAYCQVVINPKLHKLQQKFAALLK